jgi:hypothetical protein
VTNVREQLKAACALIQAGNTVGTGYLVAPDLVATCNHVVESVREGGPVHLRFRNPDLAVDGRVARADGASDCAIVQLNEPAEDRPLLSLTRGSTYDALWLTYGYPHVAAQDGVFFAGKVDDPDGRWNDRPVLVLTSDKIAAGMATPVHGLSGSPVVVGTAIVGHIASVRPDPDFPGRAAFGEVFASSCDGVLALLRALGRPAAVSAPPAPAAPAEAPPALDGRKYHAFVSYRSTDRAFALDLVERLEARGFKLYIDQNELLPGDELATSLQDGIAASRAALALVSRKWLESPWCRKEASTLLHSAIEHGTRVIPLRLDDCELPSMFDSMLWIDFAGKPRADDEGVERIVAGLVGRPVALRPPAPAAASAPVPASAWSRIEQLGQDPRDARLSSAQALISVGEPRIALSLLEDAGDGTRARQLRALALAKCRRLDEAIRELEPLYATGQIDAETGGILAGRYKEKWLEGNKLSPYLNKSFRVYRIAWERSGDLYPGVNVLAAALYLEKDAPALLAPRDRDAVAAIAKEVDRKSEEIGEDEQDNWKLATRAEVRLLVHRDLDDARRFYSLAAGAKPQAHQEIAVMRRQARRNLAYLGFPANALDDVLQMPGVVAFTGHMTDSPGRKNARFPENKVGDVRVAIRELLERYRGFYGFSSAARGSDILFAEEVLARGGVVTLFLPFPASTFKTTSVHTDAEPRWSARFDELLARAARNDRVKLEVLLPEAPPEADRPGAYAACNLAIQNAAIEHASLLDERPRLIAVWDGSPGDGAGGAADAIRDWRDRKAGEDEIIHPSR